MTTLRKVSIGQRIRLTTRPPHPASVDGVVRNIVPDGRGGVAVELQTDGGGTAVGFSALDDTVEVLTEDGPR